MHVSAIYVFPIKGAAAVPVSAAPLDSFGIEHDRRFMVVDAAGVFISQRDCHELALLHARADANALVLSSARAGELCLPLRPAHEGLVEVRVWRDTVSAVDMGDAAAAFLERHMRTRARLVFMPDDTLRQADLDHAQKGDRVSFADAFPLLLIGQASLDELNRRLARPLGMLRFRPNIVVAGAVPHAEDTWRRICLGTIECDVVKPCARCVVTTIDPETAVAEHEPLRSLATYRAAGGKVYFGQNVIHRAAGLIRVGDVVTVLRAGEPRPAPLREPAA